MLRNKALLCFLAWGGGCNCLVVRNVTKCHTCGGQTKGHRMVPWLFTEPSLGWRVSSLRPDPCCAGTCSAHLPSPGFDGSARGTQRTEEVTWKCMVAFSEFCSTVYFLHSLSLPLTFQHTVFQRQFRSLDRILSFSLFLSPSLSFFLSDRVSCISGWGPTC